MYKKIMAVLFAAGVAANVVGAEAVLPYPVLFVTQTPQPGDFTSIASVFGNHRSDLDSVPRGGALMIRYEDGTLRNLTLAAGFGQSGLQTTNSIAVREPSVYWDGTKAIFSMVIGAPKRQFDYASTFYWQIYEISNLGSNQIPVITKVANQPTNYNNVSPIYGTNGRIIFSSDRPRDGQRHLYPQLDEYEEAPTVTGLWSLDPATGDLFMLNHSPSGAFSPSIDSFGRVIFSRWDHLQRDQQADAPDVQQTYGTFNYTDESASAAKLTNVVTEVFPEPRYTISTNNAHTFNQFFPWMINQDGTEEETLNHVGRHEIGGSYRNISFNNDPNLVELYYFGNKTNVNIVENFLHPTESPTAAGVFFGIDAPEFGTHAAGQIVSITGAPSVNPDLMKVEYITDRATASATQDGVTAPTNHTGLYRNPLPLSDGRLVAAHTPETRGDTTANAPYSRYDFRLKLLKKVGSYFVPDVALTGGITNTVSWWTPDVFVSYTGQMWELDAVEVRPRAMPATALDHPVQAPEQQIFQQEGVDIANFQNYLRQRDLALIVSRNVTGRDGGDQQQPYNLRVPGGAQTIPKSGKIYDIQYMQLFQADLIRGTGLRDSASEPRDGRRVLAQQMHNPLADNVETTSALSPVSSVKIGLDGSVAAIVPARRAMTWQTTAPDGEPVVRERYWITFQPGEIRTCANCHGVNRDDQAGHPAATNPPEALRELLRHWKTNNVPLLATTTVGGATYPTVTFKRQTIATNLKYRVDVSTDLSAWIAGSIYTSTNSTQSGPFEEISKQSGPIESITLRDVNPGGPKRFYRVITEK